MIKKAEKSALLGIMALRFIAGYADALTVISYNEMIGAQTGRLTRFFVGLFSRNLEMLIDSAIVLLFFFIGNILSGLIFPFDKFKFRFRYVMLEFITGLVLIFLSFYDPFSLTLYTMSLALGIQNGMLVYYRGIRIRTTILSGHLTSLGEHLGRIIAKKATFDWRFLFYLENIVYFGLGVLAYILVTNFTTLNPVLVAGLIHLFNSYIFLKNYYRFESVNLHNYEDVLD